jgi:hypothetical protein
MFGFFKKLFGINNAEEAVSEIEVSESVTIDLGDSAIVVSEPKAPEKAKVTRAKKVREKPAPKAKKVIEKPTAKKRGRPATKK